MNNFQNDLPGGARRKVQEGHIEAVRQQGGVFVEAVRLTRMPMVVTDALLRGNPIVFANKAFLDLSGYTTAELLGQDPHFMNGEGTDSEVIEKFKAALAVGRAETLEILQYRKDGTPFRAMLFSSPMDDGQGTVTGHFLSYLDITRRYDAEDGLRLLTLELEGRVAARTRELEAANERLSSLAAEREMLLVEVNHRAKNSLAIAASLLALQGRRQSDGAVRAQFEEAQDRLNAMARVHDLLSRSEDSQRVDLGIYARDLCEVLRSITEDDARIRLKAEVEQGIFVEADTAVPLGLVLTELITNAVKYAFPAPRSGTILTRARRSRPGWVEIVVEDDGVGVSQLREGSLGYGLVRALVRQVKGEIDVRGEAGVTATISFPNAPQAPAGNGA